MSRIEINGIYKHAPLTNAQIDGTKRNLDREIIIKTQPVTNRTDLIPTVINNTTDAGAYPTSYIYAMDYDSTADGGNNPNIRRHIPTLEFLGGVDQYNAGSNWINIQDQAIGEYKYLNGGETIQGAIELIDSEISRINEVVTGVTNIKHLIDGPNIGSLTSSADGTLPSSINIGGNYQIALGVDNNITNSPNAFIGTATESTITNSTRASIISANYSNISNSSQSCIGSGNGHKIENGSGNSFIGSGNGNELISSSSQSCIGSGNANTMSSSGNSFIGSGSDNYIQNSDNSTIVCGFNSKILQYSGNSFIGTATSSEIRSSSCAIITGHMNYISTSSMYGMIGSGSNNYITSSMYSFVGSGSSNYITDCTYSAILAGTGHRVSSEYSFIGSGSNNYIEYIVAPGQFKPSRSFIGSGSSNYITNSSYSGIIAGFGNKVLNNSGYSFIAVGSYNYMNDSSYSCIGAGYSNYIIQNSSYSFSGAGSNNYINSSTRSFIGTGDNNYITSSGYSFIGTGANNIISSTSEYSFIGTGSVNQIQESTYSFIGSGNSNYITNSSYSGIIGGMNNKVLSTSLQSCIGAGINNTINDSAGASITSGSNNNILATSGFSCIGSGASNTISSSEYSSIVSGMSNDITLTSSYSFIASGTQNIITQGSYSSFIGAGSVNIISQGAVNSCIVSGGHNRVVEGSYYSFVGTGYSNYINGGSSHCAIVSGSDNIISQASSYSSILGGRLNTILNASVSSCILGGVNNILTSIGPHSSSNYFIIGSNIDNTLYQQDSSTYMNNIFLWDRGLTLKDRIPNIGDCPIVESVNGNVGRLRWGNPGGTTGMLGLQYSGEVRFNATSWTNYITLNEWNPVMSSDSIGFDLSGYSFSGSNVYSGISNGIVADGSGYILDPSSSYNIRLDCVGRYTNSNNYSYRYSSNVLLEGNGTNISFIEKNIILDQSYYTTEGAEPSHPTLTPSISINNELMFILSGLYRRSSVLYRPLTTYLTEVDTNQILINWPIEYALPGTAPSGYDQVYLWNGATNFMTSGNIVSGSPGGVVKLDSQYTPSTGEPCYILSITNLPIHKIKASVIVTKVD